MRKVIFILMASLMLPTCSIAGGVVAKTCRSWGQHRSLGEASIMLDETWLVGYLSGISTSADVDFMRTIDPDSIGQWMDHYCQAHPLKTLEQAGQDLALELGDKRK